MSQEEFELHKRHRGFFTDRAEKFVSYNKSVEDLRNGQTKLVIQLVKREMSSRLEEGPLFTAEVKKKYTQLYGTKTNKSIDKGLKRLRERFGIKIKTDFKTSTSQWLGEE